MPEESAIGSPAPDQVRAALGRVVASSVFTASPRMQAFLRYVVEETLEGRGDEIKGYTLALEVFGRGNSFDPANDSVVRVEAARLRRTLAAYYGDEGVGDTIVIDVPKGGYVPAFHMRPPAAPGPAPVVPSPPAASSDAPAAPAAAPGSQRWWRFAIVAAVAVMLVGAAAAFSWHQLRPETKSSPAEVRTELARPARPTVAVLPF